MAYARKGLPLLAASLLIGCHPKDGSEAGSKVPRLKQFLSETDELAEIQRFPPEVLTFPVPEPDEVKNGIKSHWEPANIEILPVTIEEVHKDDSKIRGANFTLNENYYVISGFGSPTEGKHEKGEAALDLDELTDLQAAIVYMKEAVAKWKSKAPELKTLVRFKSKDGLVLEVQSDAKFDGAAYGFNIDNANESLDDAQLNQLSQRLAHAVDELKSH